MADFTKITGLRKPLKLSQLPVLDVNNPEVNYMIGMRGSGKTVLKYKFVETFFDNYITTFDSWSARDGESVYPALNKNCGKKWAFTMRFLDRFAEYYIKILEDKAKDGTINRNLSRTENILEIFRNTEPFLHSRQDMMEYMDYYNDEMFDYFINIFIDDKFIKYDPINKLISIDEKGLLTYLEPPLHCNCFKAYKVILILPDYTQFDPEELKNSPANKQYYWDYNEFEKDYKNGDVNVLLPRDTNFWTVPKPDHLQQNNLKIAHFTVPSTPARKEIFLKQFTDIVLEARETHRIIVMNPMFFLGEDHKFKTLEAIINNLEVLSQTHFRPLDDKDVGKPRFQWGAKEKSWNKFSIVMDEMKTIAPSSRLSGQKSSGITKKVIYDKIGEIRHWNIYLTCVSQSNEDIFDRIRAQSNKTIIKRASENLLGESYEWLYKKINELRIEEFLKRGIPIEIIKKGEKHIDPLTVWQVDKKFPRPDQLPDDLAIITAIDNNDFAYSKVEQNKFHMKHTKDHFSFDFKLHWKFADKESGIEIEGVDLEKDTEDTGETKTHKKLEKKQAKQAELETIHFLVTMEHKKFPDIAKRLIGEEPWSKMDTKAQRNAADKYRIKYNRYLDKLNKPLI